MTFVRFLWMAIVLQIASLLPATAEERPLVVYFSWSGNSAQVARELARITNGRLVEVQPVVPYPSTYPETLIRVRNERNALYERGEYPRIRPIDLPSESSSILFVCYPLWLGKMAMPMQSFLNKHSAWLKGRVIAAVCATGKSAASKTQADLSRLCPESQLVEMLEIKRNEMDSLHLRLRAWVGRVLSTLHSATKSKTVE